MALIIKRPMPHKCDWCFYRGHCDVRMKHIHDTFGKYDSFTDPYREQRLPNCPLVEIPDEHGDLIDRNELPTIVITDYKLEAHTVFEFEDVRNAPIIVEASI